MKTFSILIFFLTTKTESYKLCSLLDRATIELGDVTPHNLQQLKRLNQVVFPVSYNDKFYKDILEAGELAKLGERSHLS